jgi:hypothetical protein
MIINMIKGRSRRPTVLLPFLVLGLVAGAAAFAPQDDNKPARKNDPQVGQSFRVPYRLTETNHYLVRVRINGKGPFNFLVDSGAPALYVGTETAQAIGLNPAEDDYWTAIDRLDFEGGATLENVNARIEDPFQLVGMNALGLPGASIDGILGFTILARYKLEFDPTDDRMTWTRIDYEPKEPYIPRELRTRKGPKAPAEVEAMSALGPLMKLAAVFVGKQPEEQLDHQGFLGIELETADDKQGVRVSAVIAGSPAAEKNVQPGDLLMRVSGRRINDLADAHKAIAGLHVGDSVDLELKRDGEPLKLTLQAGEGF